MSITHWFRRKRRQRSIRFLGIIIALCLIAAIASFGMQSLFTSVGSAKHIRYEPVDVPPEEVSPRHQKEREEYERRERVLIEKSQ